jgi:mannose-6-phosphate isomerase
MYALKFHPILKEILWGGEKICRFKGIEPVRTGIGESWELSGVADNVSVVANGKFAGKTLDELIALFGDKLLGKTVFERFGNRFPLLVKFIDAREPLSIQVHPNDELALSRHNSFGKTEMWYVVQADPGAYLYSGFSRLITPELYQTSIADGTFTDYLQRYEVSAGDAFFLPAGRVHAIGAGCLIAEIQQTSDITYRIFDYNRRDRNGNTRQLHTDLARDAINYSVEKDYKLSYNPVKNKFQTLAACPYFTVEIMETDSGKLLKTTVAPDSFAIYICLAGNIDLNTNTGKIQLKQGETALVGSK